MCRVISFIFELPFFLFFSSFYWSQHTSLQNAKTILIFTVDRRVCDELRCQLLNSSDLVFRYCVYGKAHDPEKSEKKREHAIECKRKHFNKSAQFSIFLLSCNRWLPLPTTKTSRIFRFARAMASSCTLPFLASHVCCWVALNPFVILFVGPRHLGKKTKEWRWSKTIFQ